MPFPRLCGSSFPATESAKDHLTSGSDTALGSVCPTQPWQSSPATVDEARGPPQHPQPQQASQAFWLCMAVPCQDPDQQVSRSVGTPFAHVAVRYQPAEQTPLRSTWFLSCLRRAAPSVCIQINTRWPPA